MATRWDGSQEQRSAISILLMLILLTLSSPVTPSRSLASSEVNGGASDCPRIGLLLNLLSALVDFYATDPDGINADGYFGMSVSQNVLRTVRLEDTCQEYAALLRSVLNKQQLLDQRWKRRLSGKSQYDSVTYSRICKPLANLVRRLTNILQDSKLDVTPTKGDPFLQVALGSDNFIDRLNAIRQLVHYNEAKGDTCLFETLRPGNNCPKHKVCPYFNQPLGKSSGYYLTHQLVYKMVRALTACPATSAASIITPESIPHELVAMCSKALGEYHLIGSTNWTAVALLAGDEIVTGLRDLYMEQPLICGLLGVSSFYHRQAVDRVASWQDPDTRCFKLYRGLQKGQSPSTRSGFRRILRDVEMLDGCSSHSSGMAMGFYSNAIRFLASQ